MAAIELGTNWSTEEFDSPDDAMYRLLVFNKNRKSNAPFLHYYYNAKSKKIGHHLL